MYCNFCINKNRDWVEDGFFGVKCTPCGSAYIASVEHKKVLTEEERNIVYKLIEKHYPGFQILGFGIKNLGKTWHWFEAVKNE